MGENYSLKHVILNERHAATKPFFMQQRSFIRDRDLRSLMFVKNQRPNSRIFSLASTSAGMVFPKPQGGNQAFGKAAFHAH